MGRGERYEDINDDFETEGKRYIWGNEKLVSLSVPSFQTMFSKALFIKVVKFTDCFKKGKAVGRMWAK